MTITGIYKITSQTNKIYIGQSRNVRRTIGRIINGDIWTHITGLSNIYR